VTFMMGARLAFTTVGVGAVFVVVSASGAHATAPGKNGRIAFRRYLNAAHTQGEIFTINSDGAGMRQLTHSPGNLSTEPDWSPNGPGSEDEAAGLLDAYLEAQRDRAEEAARAAGAPATGAWTGAPVAHGA
jgi:hypothetical protein